MRFVTALLLLASAASVAAFAPQKIRPPKALASRSILTLPSTFRLFSEVASSEDAAVTLEDSEWALIKDIYGQSSQEPQTLQDLLIQNLPTMHPRLIVKLRQSENSSDPALRAVAMALRTIVDSSLAGGRAVLAELLDAGEIRKLDAAIGKACRDGKLDTAFFTVLNMNMSDAAAAAPTVPAGGTFVPGQDANRMQILQHIYTRCQEEMEKTIPPGVALLNKLLRTDVDSIRANQLQHFLCPQPNIITAPDGKQITLEGASPVLVSPMLLVDALSEAVKQIRTLEKAGGIGRESAANLVESCRQVAKEARSVIGKEYGVESKVLIEFDDGLQPVFRPDSPESQYIQGV